MVRRVLLLSALLLVALTLSPVPVLAQRLSSIKAEGRFVGPGFRGAFSLQAIPGPPARGEFHLELGFDTDGTSLDVLIVKGRVERVQDSPQIPRTVIIDGTSNTILIGERLGRPLPLYPVPLRVIVTDGAVQVALLEPRLDGLPGDTILRDGRYDSPVLPARTELGFVTLRVIGAARLVGRGVHGLAEVDASVGADGSARGNIHFVVESDAGLPFFRLECQGNVTGGQIDLSRGVAHLRADSQMTLRGYWLPTPIVGRGIRVDVSVQSGGPGEGWLEYVVRDSHFERLNQSPWNRAFVANGGFRILRL